MLHLLSKALFGSKKRNLFFTLLSLAFFLSSSVQAEQLPIKTYTTADGLVSNRISRIKRDTRGFLWFCTEDGLSRFDGYSFTNYTTHQGLPVNWVDDFLETRTGIFLVATATGLCVFDPRGTAISQDEMFSRPDAQPMFRVYRPGADDLASRIKVLYEDRLGHIFCGTRRGLYQVDVSGGQILFNKIELGMPAEPSYRHLIRWLTEDQHDNLWITTDCGLYRRAPDGKTERFSTNNGLPVDSLMGILVEKNGRTWLSVRGEGEGIYEISAVPDSRGSIVKGQYSEQSGLPCRETNAIFQSSDGRLWVATDCGLSEFLPLEKRFRQRLAPQTLSNPRVWCINEDLAGNLWVGTASGAIRLAHHGFVTYSESDGLAFRDVYAIKEPEGGTVQVYTRLRTYYSSIDRFDGERFVSQKVQPRAFTQMQFDWFQGEFPFQDSHGEWWWTTKNGLYRFAKASRVEEILQTRPIAHYTVKDGLPDDFLCDMYEDRNGDLWIAIGAHVKERIVRWERATGKFQSYSDADGLPVNGVLTSLCEDMSGNLWVSFDVGGIARFQQGRFTMFTAVDGVPKGAIKQLLCDSRGRLWIAGNGGGLGRIDNPATAHPDIVKYTTADFLASDAVLSIAEDQLNCFYVGTVRGLNYVNFDTGSFRRFTTTDGLANNQVDMIFRDHSGAFWFGTATGISRLLPQPRIPSTSPPIFLNTITVAGEQQHISEIGETLLRGLELAANRNQIEISFGSLSFATGDVIQYQYQLQGADPDWHPLTAQRTVNYANLKAGSYRFLVRAVNADGQLSELPASVEFKVLAPFWRRWWFLALGAIFLASAMYALYRYRLNRLLEFERVRIRIAADLHDDIGSSLSQIAVLSEVLRRKAGNEDTVFAAPLSQIADISREAVDSMSDIVWAINPQKDHLHDLSQRMRRLASHVLPASNIEFSFTAPRAEEDIELDADVRRQVFLIFKESINNLVRHSGCQRAEICLSLEGASLVLRVRDDGKGLAIKPASEGNGLMSMQRRAQSLGGEIAWSSLNADGTTITLKVPYKPPTIRADKDMR